MALFTDNAGRRWLLEIDARGERQIRLALGLEPDQAVDPEALRALDQDQLVLVLWQLCERFARAANVSRLNFEESAVGSQAIDAVIEALAEHEDREIENDAQTEPRSPFRQPAGMPPREGIGALKVTTP